MLPEHAGPCNTSVTRGRRVVATPPSLDAVVSPQAV